MSEVKGFAPEMLSKIIVVTAATESLYRESVELESVHAILRQPFNVDQLEDVLRRMIDAPADLPKNKLRAGGAMRLKID